MRIRYTRHAARELDAILTYIAARSPQGADHVFDRIEAVLAMLCDHPRIGRTIGRPRLRRVVVTPYPYVIFYEPTAAAIVVHAIRHAARAPHDP